MAYQLSLAHSQAWTRCGSVTREKVETIENGFEEKHMCRCIAGAGGNNQYYFYKVPYSPTGDEYFSSVRGLESKRFLYSWIHANSPYAVNYKIVESDANLRMMQNETASEQPAIVFSDNYSLPFSMPADFKVMAVYNTSGGLLQELKSKNEISNLFSRISSGLYIARFTGEDGSVVTRKLIIKK